MIDAKVVDLHGDTHTFEEVDRVSYVNHETYGAGKEIGNIDSGPDGERVLVLNTSGFAVACFDT